jgi:tetratricopeptide (TPR) repeat protein
MITAYHLLGDYEKERQTIEKARELFPDRTGRTDEVRVLAALGEIKDIQRLVDESFTGLAKAGNPWYVAYEAVEELRVHGHMGESQEIADRLADRAQKQMPADPTEVQLRGLADRLYLARRWDEALSQFKNLAENYPESRVDFYYAGRMGCIAARKGHVEEARAISEELEKLDRPYLFGRHTYNRARIASLLGEKQQAVDLLNQAMREGYRFGIHVIQDQDFLPLRDFPPFQEFLKSKG